MPSSEARRSGRTRILYAVGALLVGAIYFFDLLGSREIDFPILFVGPVVLGLWLPGRVYALTVASVSTGLCLLGFLHPSPEGALAWITVGNRALSIAAIWVTALTVLAHKRIEARLCEEREQSRHHLDVAGVMIVALDASGTVTLINRTGCQILGHEPHELIGRNWFDAVIPERIREHARAAFLDLLSGRGPSVEPSENEVVTQTGESRLILWHHSILKDAKGGACGTLSSGEDITDRLQSEKTLTKTMEALQAFKYALDQSAIVAFTDRKGLITYVNRKFCEISKYSTEELIGQDHRILNSGLHPKEFMRNLWRTISAGSVWRGEIRNRAKDGTLYWVDTTIVPFVSADGKPYQYVAIRSDITDRKRAQEALVEQASLARLGQMAAVVAHEVRNPLAGIGGAIQILGEHFRVGSPERDTIGQILERIDSLNGMVEDLLLFARPRAPQFERLDLVLLLSQAKGLLTEDPQLRDVEVELPMSAPQIAGDPVQLHAVFQNLILNAAQAMGATGKIQVSVETSNGRCRIVVSDSGPGIPPDIRERIFDPFFTTKHRGTGLGLAIARRAVIAHGGDIEVECPGEGGTRMIVSLPIRSG